MGVAILGWLRSGTPFTVASDCQCERSESSITLDGWMDGFTSGYRVATNWRKLFLWLIYYCHFYFLYKSIMFWGLCVPKIASVVLSLQQKYDEYGDF